MKCFADCYEERPTHRSEDDTVAVSAQEVVTVKTWIGRVRSIIFRRE